MSSHARAYRRDSIILQFIGNNVQNFTPLTAFFGGALIGVSVTLLLWFNGRLAGVSGIMNGVFNSPRDEMIWRLLFLGGLIIGAFLFNRLHPGFVSLRQGYPWYLLLVGGFLVGFGTRMGGGCTSGHGICGIARFSQRSIVATLLFMSTGIATVFMVRHLLELGQ